MQHDKAASKTGFDCRFFSFSAINCVNLWISIAIYKNMCFVEEKIHFAAPLGFTLEFRLRMSAMSRWSELRKQQNFFEEKHNSWHVREIYVKGIFDVFDWLSWMPKWLLSYLMKIYKKSHSNSILIRRSLKFIFEQIYCCHKPSCTLLSLHSIEQFVLFASRPSFHLYSKLCKISCVT